MTINSSRHRVTLMKRSLGLRTPGISLPPSVVEIHVLFTTRPPHTSALLSPIPQRPLNCRRCSWRSWGSSFCSCILLIPTCSGGGLGAVARRERRGWLVSYLRHQLVGDRHIGGSSIRRGHLRRKCCVEASREAHSRIDTKSMCGVFAPTDLSTRSSHLRTLITLSADKQRLSTRG